MMDLVSLAVRTKKDKKLLNILRLYLKFSFFFENLSRMSCVLN